MRMILLILISVALASCKDWRQKRDERLFMRLCERRPDICRTDSSAIITTYPKVNVSFKMDSTIKYISNKRDTLTIRIDSDSIYITEVSSPDTVIRYVTKIRRSPEDIKRINNLEDAIRQKRKQLRRAERSRAMVQLIAALGFFTLIIITIAAWVRR